MLTYQKAEVEINIKRLPKKVETCNILEVNTEFRFETSSEFHIIYPHFFSILNGKGYMVEKLPLSDIHHELVAKDQNLNFLPMYRFHKENRNIFLGLKYFSFNLKNEYLGWINYCEFVDDLINDFINTGCFSKLFVSIRYLDFFKNKQIIEDMDVDITFHDPVLKSRTSHSRTIQSIFENKEKYLSTRLVVVENTSLMLEEGAINGSIIDTTTFYNLPLKAESVKIKSVLNDLHDEIKQVYFHSLKADFIEGLKPTY